MYVIPRSVSRKDLGYKGRSHAPAPQGGADPQEARIPPPPPLPAHPQHLPQDVKVAMEVEAEAGGGGGARAVADDQDTYAAFSAAAPTAKSAAAPSAIM